MRILSPPSLHLVFFTHIDADRSIGCNLEKGINHEKYELHACVTLHQQVQEALVTKLADEIFHASFK